jgi:hypothetical protein
MIFVAESTDYWLNYGKDYAAGMGATVDPRIAAAQKRLASMKTGGQVQDETTALYQPAIGAAGRLGEDVNRVGMSGLSALGGLGASLPGFNPNMLADAARGTSRAGGSAALMGGVLGTNVQQNLASSIMENRQNLEGQRFLNEDKVVSAEEDKAKLLADYLQYAQGGQTIETGAINNTNIQAQTGLTNAQTTQTTTATPTYGPNGEPTNEAARNLVAQREGTQANTSSTVAGTPTYDADGNPTNEAARVVVAGRTNTEANTSQTVEATPKWNEDGSPANNAAEQEQANLGYTNAQIASTNATAAKTIQETLGIAAQDAANLGLTLAQTDQINKMTPLQVDEAKASINSIRLANKATRAEIDRLPEKVRFERLMTLANIKGVNLNNALVVAELKKAGWTSSEINKAKNGIIGVNEGSDS